MLTDDNRRRGLRRVLGLGTKVLPRVLVRLIQRVRGRPPLQIPFGTVRFGDFGRLSPIGGNFGWERGTPVDRHFIESFIARNATDIRGRVLELGDDRYTRGFGGARVEKIDILSIETTNPRATIVGDLQHADTLPEAVFDCIVLTHVLQLVFDLRAAIESLYRALKPGGVLLVTMPGVTPMAIPSYPDVPWYWALTTSTLNRLLEARFGQAGVSVEAHGNILAATSFLYGLAVEELDTSDLNVDDSTYPVVVAARAVKSAREVRFS
jgi:SAM-dependent methyltransferase